MQIYTGNRRLRRILGTLDFFFNLGGRRILIRNPEQNKSVSEDLKKNIIISSSFLLSEKIKKYFRELSADVFFLLSFLNKNG